MSLLQNTVATPYNQAVEAFSSAGNRPYSTQPLPQLQQSQMSGYGEYSILRGSQSTQFGPELGNSDRFNDGFILAS